MDEATNGKAAPPPDANTPIPTTVDLDAGPLEILPADANPAHAADPLTRDTEVLARSRVRYTSGAAAVPPNRTKARSGWDNPTQDDLRTYQDLAEHPAARTPRLRWWIAAAVAVIVIAGAALVLLHFRSNQSAPAQAVRQYFSDLASGDTAAAMDLVDDASSYTTSADPLLASTTLAKPGDRPSEAIVSGSAATTVDGAQSATAVSVTYNIDGTPVRQTIVVETAPGGSNRPYLLKAPFITVAVKSAKSRSVKVNGIGYPSDAPQMLAFPGAYAATVAGSQLVAPATARATYDSKSGAVTANIWLPAPEIAPGATAAVQSAVNRALDACAASTSPAPGNCPFHYSDSGATLKWKITTYPRVKAKVDNSGAVTFDDGGHPATFQYDATTDGFLGLFPRTRSGAMSVDVAGAAATGSNGVTVTFSH